jgi:uncharacterized protein
MSRAGTIDGLQFARDRDTVSGQLEIGAFPRLAESGCQSATIRYTVRGGQDAEGHPCLAVEASGVLRLTCQRCLGALDFPVELSAALELATSEQAIAAAEDDVDRVLATRAMGVASLVEDEVLLALPIAPMHERCEVASASGDSSRGSRFAALADWRKGGSGGG